ncbi:MAG: hypothetical protein NZT92_13435 [Abditibacteriales bacterium]|nr:hypothetical protein [Abditibacteriales bacterium]MDW8366493.1 hypothetical protein [Abditibacteriales bacterium]
MQPQDYSRRVEEIGGQPVAITSYKLENEYYAKAEIALMGAGARIAEATAPTREDAEAKLLRRVRTALKLS